MCCRSKAHFAPRWKCMCTFRGSPATCAHSRSADAHLSCSSLNTAEAEEALQTSCKCLWPASQWVQSSWEGQGLPRGEVVSQPRWHPIIWRKGDPVGAAFAHLSLSFCRLLHVHRGIPAPGDRRQSPAHQPSLQYHCQVLLCLLLLPHVREAHW